MYYLIQSNIYSDPDHHKTFEVLDDLGFEYEAIELDASMKTITIKADRKDVFVYGSVKLARLTKANTNWNPGSFYGGNHNSKINANYYKNNLLNYPITVSKFADTLQWKPNETKFIKPYQDAKIFTGRIFTETKWVDFVKNELENPKTKLLNTNSLVQISSPKKIFKEARVWIVGKKVIASIYYKFHGDMLFETNVEEEGIKFAEKMIHVFNVADAFVMDICLTNEGWKIVEINCINSAGFYHLNPRILFRALDIYFS